MPLTMNKNMLPGPEYEYAARSVDHFVGQTIQFIAVWSLYFKVKSLDIDSKLYMNLKYLYYDKRQICI